MEHYVVRYQKPAVVAKLIYYNTIYKIETKKPYGNFYQTYLELRNQKMNRTKFLYAVREELIRRTDEQDGK